MQLFFGTCLFFIAVVLLAYMPGKLLLVLLRRTLTPLEDVTLACFLGLIVSGLVYWLITFAHQSRLYFIWPLATGAVFIWLQGRTTRSLLRRSANVDVSDKQSHETRVRQISFSVRRNCRAWSNRAGFSANLLHQPDLASGWHHACISGA